MKYEKRIANIKERYYAAMRALRPDMARSICDFLARHTTSGRLDIQVINHNAEFYGEELDVLVEVDRNTGDMGWECVNSIERRREDEFICETDSGGASSKYMQFDDLESVYGFISTVEEELEGDNPAVRIENGILVEDDE